MKIDIVSVFPEYFEVMNLSLMGKAQAKGLLEIKAHNLRDWTHDLLGFSQPSGSPAPSGAPVLIFPNPSAPLFTQRDATELSHADHLLFGCGRYEGYDARIPDYYRAQGVDVREYSIGDYVLNGGEVAVSVMLEAITRLMPGFMGNPDSIVEESYTGEGALLEHRRMAWYCGAGRAVVRRPRQGGPFSPRRSAGPHRRDSAGPYRGTGLQGAG